MGDDIDDEFEPLECVPLPVAIEGYDVGLGGRETVRLFFTPRPGGNLRPGSELSDVVILEQWDRVAIALVRRTSWAMARMASAMAPNRSSGVSKSVLMSGCRTRWERDR